MVQNMDPKFHPFTENIGVEELPENFTYPYAYEIHPLARRACEELQKYLQEQQEFNHDFGIDHFVEGSNVGKMFGILLVKTPQGEVGYLAAFSGKLARKNHWSYFVPPVVDHLGEEGFYRKGEKELEEINRTVARIERELKFGQWASHKVQLEMQRQREVQDFKERIQQNKKRRSEERAQLIAEYSKKNLEDHREEDTEKKSDEGDFIFQTKGKLIAESIQEQKDFKELKTRWRNRIAECEERIQVLQNEVLSLKEERKKKSAALQKKMFDQYAFLNARKEKATLWELFARTPLQTPPSGAGDCAAPKLLQYAFSRDYLPLALGEFWWGQSPKAELRRHGHYYPACKGKCQPLLAHMLSATSVEPNPMLAKLSDQRSFEVVFEDEFFIAVNKPAEMLSVPGTTEAPNLLDLAKRRWSEDLKMVHRLDMSTSGILLIAKGEASYTRLQELFIRRKIHKTYRAILEGVPKHREGRIELPIAQDYLNRPRQKVCSVEGKAALTRYQVVRQQGNDVEVLFYPETGRTHQLRIHSAHQEGLNCPIKGDDLYGKRGERLYLHAERLNFVHPFTGQRIEIYSPSPWDFTRVS